MNQTRTLVEMGNFYENAIIEEKKSIFPPKGTFKKVDKKEPTEAEADKNAFVKNTGPENADGFRDNLIDTKVKSKKENLYQPEKFSQNYEKTEVKTINNFMSKSIFDKLYEDVMSDQAKDTEAVDAAALGLPSVDSGNDSGEEGEVSFTLPRDIAHKLCDALKAVLDTEEEVGGEEDAGGEEGDANEDEEFVPSEDAEAKAKKKDEEKDEDSEGVAKEATELKELPTSAGQGLQKKDNKVGDVTKSLTSSGAGDAKVTDKVGNDGEKGHALVGAGIKGANAYTGKSNKVDSKTSKVASYLAGLK
jgi:hypothetical protein